MKKTELEILDKPVICCHHPRRLAIVSVFGKDMCHVCYLEYVLTVCDRVKRFVVESQLRQWIKRYKRQGQ